MSSDIIYNQFFVKLPNSQEAVAAMEQVGGFQLDHERYWMTRESKYFWLMQAGSTNCYSQDGTRARSWCIPGMGSSMILRAIQMSTDIEGGMLLPGGRSSSPERFIKNIRTLVKQAIPLEALPVPSISWSLPEALVNDDAERPEGDRERRISQAAKELARHPYTKHLVETGRLVVMKDSWPFDDRQVVRFKAAESKSPAFLADYLWLSLLETHYGEATFRTDPRQHLEWVFDGWAEAAAKAIRAA